MVVAERRRGLRARPLVPLSFVAMALLGPALFYALWPWVWHDTVARVGAYLAFHGAHPHYNMEYFGVTYFRPPHPLSYPFVMAALTLPATTLALGAVGLWTRVALAAPGRWLARLSLGSPEGRKASQGADLLVIAGMLWPMAIIAWPTVPIFGGTKHFLPAMPMIAILAGVGLDRAARSVASLVPRGLARRAVAAATAIVLLAPAAIETVASHPLALSHYNVLIGGTPGAADAGMNRQFWGYTTAGVLDFLNERVPPGGRVFFHDTAFEAFEMYRADGTLRPDIGYGGTEASDVALVHHEQHMAHVEYEIWERFGTAVPAHLLLHEGVPVVSVYERCEEQPCATPP
jgi:hypothetical protein